MLTKNSTLSPCLSSRVGAGNCPFDRIISRGMPAGAHSSHVSVSSNRTVFGRGSWASTHCRVKSQRHNSFQYSSITVSVCYTVDRKKARRIRGSLYTGTGAELSCHLAMPREPTPGSAGSTMVRGSRHIPRSGKYMYANI